MVLDVGAHQQAVDPHALLPTLIPPAHKVMAFRIEFNSTYSSAVGSIMAAFSAAGANTTWMPAPDAAALGTLAVPYNLASWPGGQYVFVSCDLARRSPEYVGTCQANTVSCGASTADGVPYNCTLLADNSSVAGNLSSSAYREACELPCDMVLDCAALCDCGLDGCAANQVRATAETTPAELAPTMGLLIVLA
jgi:hypothetical protein